MDKEKVNEAAAKLFKFFLEAQLSEAEFVSAICTATTMRLAYDCSTFEELDAKVQRLGEIFKQFARANLEGFKASIQAGQQLKEQAREPNSG